MAKTSIYLPQRLADKVRELDLNLSRVVQGALEKTIEEHTGCCARCGRPLDLEPTEPADRSDHHHGRHAPMADKPTADPRIEAVTEAILTFDWHNFGLDEVGEIEREHAEYAPVLAGEIVAALDRVAGC